MIEIILFFSLISGCYPAKFNFRKINKGNLTCSLKCDSEESQTHIFGSCKPMLDKHGVRSTPSFSNVFGTKHEQKEAITVLVVMEDIRIQILKELSSME